MKQRYTNEVIVKQPEVKPSVNAVAFEQKLRAFTKLAERSPQQTDLELLNLAKSEKEILVFSKPCRRFTEKIKLGEVLFAAIFASIIILVLIMMINMIPVTNL